MADNVHGVADLLADALDLSGAEINDVLNRAPFLAAIPVVESSNGTEHKYIRYVTPPQVGFRNENEGRDLSSSEDVTVIDSLKILDFSWRSDKAVADAWRQGGAPAYIAREGNRHVGSAMFEWEEQIFYGTNNDALGFVGLAELDTLNQVSDMMVIDAGGTTAGTGASVYLIRVGNEGLQGVYKGDGPSIELGETIVIDVIDTNQKHYPAYYTPGTVWAGLQVGGMYTTARIANLTEDAGAGLTDSMLYEAYMRFPANLPPTHCVMNRRSLGQLRDSRTATNATGAPAPIPETVVGGIPVITTDALVNTETLLV